MSKGEVPAKLGEETVRPEKADGEVGEAAANAAGERIYIQ